MPRSAFCATKVWRQVDVEYWTVITEDWQTNRLQKGEGS
jgi:hypothetical protein